MVHQKTKYILTTLLLVFILSESCSTNSRGLFEKRKHLKGWHIHKKTSVSQKSPNTPNDTSFKKKNDVLNVRYQTRYSANSKPLKVRKPQVINTSKVEKELVEIRSTSEKLSENKQEGVREEKREPAQLIAEKTAKKSSFKSSGNIEESNNQWQINGAYFFLLMLFPLAFQNRKRKQVQLWVARNKGKSRTLLVVAKVLLAVTSIGLGFLIGVPFSLPLLLLSIGLLVLNIGVSKFWNSNNTMTKKKELGILGVANTSTSFGFFSLGGMFANGFRFSEWSLNSGLLNYSTNPPENDFLNHPVLIITGIILLTAFLATLLIFVGWISCNVYCSSSEALGIIIFAVGYFFFIFGYVYLIQKLFERENDSGERRKFKIAAIISSSIVVLLTLYVSFFGFP